MSSERSSSAVRNLRSIFENKSSDAVTGPDHRGRSSAGWHDDTPSRPTSKVRASFVPVEPATGSTTMASTMEEGETGSGMPELTREESSASRRRGSFSEGSDRMLPEPRKTLLVSEEAERREKASNVAEAIPEFAMESAAATPSLAVTTARDKEMAMETPLVKVEVSKKKEKKGKKGKVEEKEAVKSEEGVAAVVAATEGEQSAVKTAEPVEPVEQASAGRVEVLKPVVKDPQAAETPQSSGTVTESPLPSIVASAPLHSPAPSASDTDSKPAATAKTTSQPTEAAKTSVVAPKPAPSSKTTAPVLKSPTTTISHPKPDATKTPTKKASRSSLTAPTAASVARMAAGTAASHHSLKHSPPSKPKPRDATKPIDLPSRLTAPTAASRAKHEPELAKPSSATSRPKPHSTKPTSRSSLAPGQRPGSSGSTTAGKKQASHPPDGSFLERMMRPTAASAGKTHDKVETSKSPGRKSTAAAQAKASVSSAKTNGHVKKPAKIGSSRPGTARSEDASAARERLSGLRQQAGDGERGKEEGHATPVETAEETVHVGLANDNKGETTPQTNGETRAMEATPAFGDGEIR